jgi:hypothetical protein
MAKVLNIDTDFLFKEKERINKMIEDFFNDKDFQEILDSFDDCTTIILIEMGKVLHKFTVQYLKDNDKEIKDLVYYFWPGFSTMENKRISICGAKTENDKQYFTGIGWDENNTEFRNCPATIAFDQVLNHHNFDGYNFYPGSTHHFRINQNNFKKNYLKLRLKYNENDKEGTVFKALHVTTDEQFKEDEHSLHTLLIKVPQADIKNSGFIVKTSLDSFLKQNNDGAEDKYLWKWPFNPLPYEEKIESKNKTDLCKDYQKNDINIQTHLYSYWIAKTLGGRNTFDNISKEAYKQKLQEFLENRGDEQYLREKLDFLDKTNAEKERIAAIDSTNYENSYKEIYFKHWYTLYHEGVTIKEDLGSTMFLTSHELPLELLYYVASWIEDIYNNLKLIESKAITNRHRSAIDFHHLYHIQLPYFDLFKSCIEQGNNLHDLIPIIEYLRIGLNIVGNYWNTPQLTKDLGDKDLIDVLEVIKKSQAITHTLCKNDNILGSFFKINSDQEKNSFKSLAEQSELIVIENENSVKFNTYKEAFEIIIHELLFNAIKHSIPNNPNIRIVFGSTNGSEQTIHFYNNSKYSRSKEMFQKALDKTIRLGVKIIRKLSETEILNIKLSHEVDDNNIVCTTIKFTKYGQE